MSSLKGVFLVATMSGNKLSIARESVAGQSASTRLNGATFVDATVIHLRKRGHPVPAHLDRAATAATRFVGAELEAVVIEALFTAFDEGQALDLGHLLSAINATKPMSCLMKETIDGLRKWAEGRARHASSRKDAPRERVRKLNVAGAN